MPGEFANGWQLYLLYMDGVNSLRCFVQRKLILKYAHKYRLGLWRPRAEPVKSWRVVQKLDNLGFCRVRTCRTCTFAPKLSQGFTDYRLGEFPKTCLRSSSWLWSAQNSAIWMINNIFLVTYNFPKFSHVI